MNQCACGCGAEVRGYFKSGHNARVAVGKVVTGLGYSSTEWAQANRERRNELNRRSRHRAKQAAMARYGGGCACCGTTELVWLCIDHINGGGLAHRKQYKAAGYDSIYTWLRANEYPEGYQVLCHNCNFAKDQEGGCPHQWS